MKTINEKTKNLLSNIDYKVDEKSNEIEKLRKALEQMNGLSYMQTILEKNNKIEILKGQIDAYLDMKCNIEIEFKVNFNS